MRAQEDRPWLLTPPSLVSDCPTSLDLGDPFPFVADAAHEYQKGGRPTSAKSVPHVRKHGGQHAPTHSLAEFDHAGSEAMARLSQVLHRSSRRVVLLRHRLDGYFVREITQLEGLEEAVIGPPDPDLGWRDLFEFATLSSRND